MSAADLLGAADRALYLAKRTGKDRVAVASPDAEGELDRLRDSGGSPAAVQALVAAIEARDNYSFDHSELVVRLATGVALLLGLPADAVERVGHCALLHDVGKLAIPPAILHKDGELDDAEWTVMAEHPVLGEKILRRIPELAPLAPIVRHEHEHWDGSGYPDGLAGTQIPIGSRIVLACDAYAAMTTERPYRRALTSGRRGGRAARGRGLAVRPAGGRGAARPPGPRPLTDQTFAASVGRLRRRDQRRAVGQPGRPVLALVLLEVVDVGLRALRLRVVARVAVAAGLPDVALAHGRARASGAQVGTVSATRLPFSTGSVVASGNCTVWPKYGVSVCSGLRASTRA